MEICPLQLRRDMEVTGLYNVHYIEIAKNYVFTGESHPYWEVLYVDRSNLLVTLDEETFPAVSGDLILIAPGQFHAFRGDGKHDANVMLVGFECDSPQMEVLRGTRHPSFSYTIMSFIHANCRAAFQEVPSDPYKHTLVRKADAWPGAETFISIAITEMLLTIWRHKEKKPRKTRSVVGGKTLVQEIGNYMRAHLDSKLTLKQLADEFHISKSYIQRIFARQLQKGAMHYFTELKMERARELLRAKELNVTKIAEQLGYDDIHYFSKQFKMYVNMSPLQYRNSIRNFTEEIG